MLGVGCSMLDVAPGSWGLIISIQDQSAAIVLATHPMWQCKLDRQRGCAFPEDRPERHITLTFRIRRQPMEVGPALGANAFAGRNDIWAVVMLVEKVRAPVGRTRSVDFENGRRWRRGGRGSAFGSADCQRNPSSQIVDRRSG